MKMEYALSKRKARILEMAERLAPEREQWIRRNAFYYEQDREYMRFLIPAGLRVLDLGCGTGSLLASLEPSYGVGVDMSPRMIEIARRQFPHLEFVIGDVERHDIIESLQGPFDVIVLSDTIGSLEDCQATFENLHALCTPETRVIVAYYSRLWEPLLRTAERIGQKMPLMQQNWLSSDDIASLLRLADFEVIKREWRQLVPKRLLGLGRLINSYVAPWPLIRRACLRDYVVARPARSYERPRWSTSVIVPCRNEQGNIESAVTRLPPFCEDIEIIFVEGHSKDGTLDEIKRVITAYPKRDIKLLVQDGRGKGDAVRKGFAHARGDVLMILDADLTTPPEWMPKFYEALVSRKGEFVNGTRLVYPMEDDAMQMLNHAANRVFSWLFTWLLNQRFTDTLCGTKVLTRRHYSRIAANRGYFGEFDPFGDFDLIFGAAKLNLKVVEIPVAYASRTYGETQISRFRHGWLLLRMVVFAFRKLKAF
ncbi:MAG TPA: glycosyltransferase [Burkholderiales bacterium]|nr:glycosyltransferase [Burkholderiales bacterium]